MSKLQVNIILEILGRPPENVQQALKGLVARLGSEPGIKVMEQTLHEPKPVENTKNLFTAFAELTLELDSLNNYFGLIFSYMPANIELIYPEQTTLKSEELNVLGNRLLQRLHDYDALTKKMIVERDMVVQKLQEVAPHLFKQQNQQQVQAQPNSSNKEIKSSKKKTAKSKVKKNKK